MYVLLMKWPADRRRPLVRFRIMREYVLLSVRKSVAVFFLFLEQRSPRWSDWPHSAEERPVRRQSFRAAGLPSVC